MSERHPNYRPPGAATATAEGPADTGQRLATLDRPGWQGKADTELRVSLAEHEGHRYLNLRVWTLDARAATWWPDKSKGCTVRLGEAEAVAAALLAGLELAGGAPEARGKGERPDRAREWAPREAGQGGPKGTRQPSGPDDRPGPPTTGDDFDEFGG